MSFFRPIIQRLGLWNWLLVALLISPPPLISAQTQDYIVKTWGVDDGLPESSISDVIQSKDGYLWVSTLNSGLSRFDGVRFVNFDLPFASQFISGAARRLFAGDDGSVWINGFGNYMACLHDGVFGLEKTQPVVVNWLVWQRAGRVVFVTKEGQLLERRLLDGTNSVWKIIPAPGSGPSTRFFADTQGNFWYRRLDGQLGKLAGDKAELISLPSGETSIAALGGDRQGRIAAGSPDGLYVWESGGFRDLTPTNPEPELPIRGLAPDGQGGWWMEAGGRLRRCQDRHWIAEALEWREQKRTWSRVRWEQPDAVGGLWLAYTDGGVVHVGPNGKMSAMTSRDGLPSNRVRTLTQDREGNMWASFERGGLLRIRPRLFQAVGRQEGLADSVTTSVCEDTQGAIWIGTLSGVVSCWNHGVCSNFTLPLEGTHCEMSTVYPDSGDRVWVGTHGNGVWLYEGGQFHHVLSTSQVGVNIRGILVSHDGHTWIASQDGLFCYSNGAVQQVQRPKSEADYPAALAEGVGGAIWVAMNTGVLMKLVGDKTTTFKPSDALMHSRFASVCEDSRGTVWIGTLGAGLLRFHDGEFAAFTKQDGLPSDNISQVLEDGMGGLWLGSPAGVISFRKEFLNSRTGSSLCRVFGRDDGLPTLGCATASQPTAWRAREGRLWFATANGVTCVMPGDSETRPYPPTVKLEEVLVDGQLATPAGPGSASLATTPIRLTPGRHQLEFRYTGLSFNDPERLQFEYFLEGLDSAWVESSERTVSYLNLPPGEYRFRVKARNSEGVTSESDASISLILPPHLWETRWFQFSALGAILISVAASVFWILQLRHNRQLRALQQQQAVERERARIARDIHDDLGVSLTRIAMLSQSAMDKSGSQTPVSEVNRIYSTARAMTNAMDEIVWAINPRNDSIESIAAYFAEFVEEFLSPTALRFRLEIPLVLPPWSVSAEVRHNLFLAFKEALNNALKHAKASEVVVSLDVRPDGFVLSVEDDGCGFETAVPAGNYDKYNGAGDGNGLINMHRRLEELGGRCMIRSVPGHGTRVSFEVKVKSA